MPTLAHHGKSNFITYLKFWACLLILNSHCRDVYPYYFFALGGGHGNAIFFAVSGFCLADIKLNFFAWFKKRMFRILPVTLVVLVAGVLYNLWTCRLDLTAVSIFRDILNRYWFVWAVLIYYVIFYLIVRNGCAKRMGVCLTIFFVGYAVLYGVLYCDETFFVELEGFTLIKVYFYFGVMLVGGLLRLKNEKFIQFAVDTKAFVLLSLILSSVTIWICEYSSMFVFHKLYALQFLIHVAIITFVVLAMLFAKKLDKYIAGESKFFKLVVKPIAECTLEIYLVQITFKYLIMNFEFPVNWFLFIIGSIVLGVFLNRLYGRLKKFAH